MKNILDNGLTEAQNSRVMELAKKIQREYTIKASAERAVSTLKMDPRFSSFGFVQSLNMKTGFMALYRNMIKNPRWTWASFATGLLFPQLEQVVPTAKQRAPYVKFINKAAEYWTEAGISSLVRIKKGNDTFHVTVPVFAFSNETANQTAETLRFLFCGPKANTPGLNTNSDISLPTPIDDSVIFTTHTISVKDIRDTNGMFRTDYLAKLRTLNNGVASISIVGSSVVVFLSFDVTTHQAEYMCQTPWIQIRPIDFYGMIREWINGRLGYFRDPPRFALPLAFISNAVKGVKGEPRTDENGLLVDENANYWYIPETTDNISKYDSELRLSLTRPDGSLSSVPMSGKKDEHEKLTPPPSQPVFTDWVNLKFAYSSAEGTLIVKSLDRCLAVNATHATRLLRTKLDSDRGKNIYSLLNAISVGQGLPALPSIKELLPQLVNFVHARDNEGETEAKDLELADLLTINLISNQVWKAIHTINELASTSFETLCVAYTVSTVCNVVAFTKIAAVYGQNLEVTYSADRESRKPYANQFIDPKYEGDSIPYVGEGKGFMPHQKRAQNQLRTSPKFAVLAVAAGGGKTTMIITDLLKEMKLGHVHRGLIMCPSHLVGQYVKEFVYFTEGRVNVIAVNSYSMHKRRQGLDGLEQMIRTAPINTVVVTDYNIGNGKTKKTPVGYGVSPTNVFPVVEMLRKFKFDYVAADESHYLKGTTGRQNAVARLIADIPYKRLASGTIAPNSLMDLVKQVSLFDPTIFGSQADFIGEYALEVRGNKVMSWKPGAENAIMARLKQSVTVVSAKRKEWAAFLPEYHEEAFAVELNTKQREVYKSILEEVTALIQEEMAKNKTLRFLMSGKTDVSEEGDEDEIDVDSIDIDALLKPYLQRLEKFVVSPATDPLGMIALQGEDKLSPKVIKIIELIKTHLAKNTGGKILVFCNYVQSAQTIYDALPPELKAQAILYSAANKAECGAEFETNHNKKIMIGVEVSMNTGLNLQFCDLLIRCDSVWTPGALEQGNSRIGRPNIKTKETRKGIYVWWVVASGTIDITKLAYLVSKRVVITKFEEAGNPNYSDELIPSPPLFPMTLETIADSNTTTAESLAPAFESYTALQKQVLRDYKEYKVLHPEDMNEDGSCKMTPIVRSSNLADSKLMYRVPYVPGLDIYNSDQLGLARYDQYLMQDTDDTSDDEEDDDEGKETDSQREQNRAELTKVAGLWVHTEYGDGQIVGVSRKFVRVELSNGNKVTTNKLSTFVINRAQTNHADMRTLILKESGDIPFDVPYDIQVKNQAEVVIPKKKAAPIDDRIHIALQLVVVNDIVALEFDGVEKNPGAARALEANHFSQPPAYVYAKIRDYRQLYAQFKAWHEAGFTIDPAYNKVCKTFYQRLQTQRKNAAHMYGVASDAQVKNFFRLQHKANPDRKQISPYPLVYEDTFYIALPTKGHPATAKAIQTRVPGVRFYTADVHNQLSVQMASLGVLDRNIHIFEKKGFVITNLEDLLKERKRLQRVMPKLVTGLHK